MGIIPPQEQETIINFCPADSHGSVFTNTPRVWKRLEKIPGFELVRTETFPGGKIYGKEFGFPGEFFRVTSGGFLIRVKRGQK